MKDERYSDEGQTETVQDPRKVIHKISADEAFTLAKDVYDIRCLVKSVYANRAQIKRRLNFVGTIGSICFTLLYVAFMIFSGITKITSLASQVIIYTIIGVYAALTVAVIVFSLLSSRSSTTKNVKKKNNTLKILRYVTRVVSLIMGITAIIISAISGTDDSMSIALNTVATIVSIVFVIFSALPLIFGGFGGLARWLLSPTKIKRRFSFVVLEWYELLVSDNGNHKTIKKVSKEYVEDIGRIVDGNLLPSLGRKYIQTITVSNIYSALELVPEEDKAVTEGVLKNVFGYAEECGYVNVNPCKDMNLEGSIEVAEKPKKPSLKEKIGKKLGKGIINSIFGDGGDS